MTNRTKRASRPPQKMKRYCAFNPLNSTGRPIPLFTGYSAIHYYRKAILSAALIVAATATAFAQGNGIAGINEATSMVSSYFDPGTKLIYAIGAVVGLIGGVKVYGKFSSGDPDTSKTAASWFGACIFLIVAATILRSFFL